MTASEIIKMAEFDKNAAVEFVDEHDFGNQYSDTEVFFSGARFHAKKLSALIEALAQSCEEMNEVLEYILRYDQNSPERRRMKDALSSYQARMEKLK